MESVEINAAGATAPSPDDTIRFTASASSAGVRPAPPPTAAPLHVRIGVSEEDFMLWGGAALAVLSIAVFFLGIAAARIFGSVRRGRQPRRAEEREEGVSKREEEKVEGGAGGGGGGGGESGESGDSGESGESGESADSGEEDADDAGAPGKVTSGEAEEEGGGGEGEAGDEQEAGGDEHSPLPAINQRLTTATYLSPSPKKKGEGEEAEAAKDVATPDGDEALASWLSF